MTRHPTFATTIHAFGLLVIWPSPAAVAQAIPVRAGVTLVYATKPVDSDLRPDFERLLTVETVSPDGLVLQDYVAYALKPTGEIISSTFHRTLSVGESGLSRSLF